MCISLTSCSYVWRSSDIQSLNEYCFQILQQIIIYSLRSRWYFLIKTLLLCDIPPFIHFINISDREASAKKRDCEKHDSALATLQNYVIHCYVAMATNMSQHTFLVAYFAIVNSWDSVSWDNWQILSQATDSTYYVMFNVCYTCYSNQSPLNVFHLTAWQGPEATCTI